MSNVAFLNVSKTFSPDIHALRDVNLEIAGGEYLVIAGPSGSGKTTLLRLVAGLDSPTAGDILIAGGRINDVPPADRDVAMVFQSAALYPHLTVERNLAFGLAHRRLAASEVQSRIVETADMLAISPLLDRLPAEISGGERQRVAIGRALIRRPRVLLLDEPLSDLDFPLRARLRSDLARLRGAWEITVLHVTHDQSEAMALGDRVCLLCGGAVQQTSPPQVIYDRPANAFVASFMGSPGMNLLRGELCDRGLLIGDGGGSLRIDLPQSALTNTARGANGPVLLGVRPEDLHTFGAGIRLPPVVIERTESLGHESIAYFQLGGGGHAVRLPASTEVRRGDSLVLTAAEEKLHWFSAADGRRLD
jgi:ABC-type sugar transport system ATPase subunit